MGNAISLVPEHHKSQPSRAKSSNYCGWSTSDWCASTVVPGTYAPRQQMQHSSTRASPMEANIFTPSTNVLDIVIFVRL